MTEEQEFKASEIRIIVDEHIPQDQLLRLYESVGWFAYTTGKRRSELATAIRKSSYVVAAWQENRLIGLARCLSDDSSIFYLQDILVDPEFQRCGVGRRLFEACIHRYEHIRAKVLMTDDEERQRQFYQAMGFTNTKDLASQTLNVYVDIEGVE